jgi:uncharacterized membrane protein
MMRRLLVCIAISCTVTASACSDRGAVDPADIVPIAPAGLVISNPQFPLSNLSVHVGGASVNPSSDTVIYVSLAEGTMPEATNVRIRNKSLELVVPVIDGGFDPVAIAGNVADEIVLNFEKSGSSLLTLTVKVPVRRPPRVVRTNPSKGRTDVAFNVSISIVFSEQISSATANASNIKLLKNGVAVDAAVTVAGNSFTAVVVPAAPLEPETSYEIDVSQNVSDMDGEPLETSYAASFVTRSKTSVISVESRLPSNGWVMQGDTVTINAVVRDANGVPTGDSVVWSQSYNGLIVQTTRQTAHIRATGESGFTITASFGTLRASFAMNVAPARQFAWSRQGFIWTESQGMVALPRPDGVISVSPAAINDRGEVAGNLELFDYRDGGRFSHAFVWSRSTGMTDIGATMPPWSLSSAEGIDSDGRVVGYAGNLGGRIRAFRWSRELGIELLDSTFSYQITTAGAGWIAGWRSSERGTVPYRWKSTMAIEDLPIANGSNVGVAYAINDAGQSVGYDGNLNLDDQGPVTAVFWDERGARVELISCAGEAICYSAANAINNHGQVVGSSNISGLIRPFRWSRDTGLVFLVGSQVPTDFQPAGINDSGDIVGNFSFNGPQRAFLLRVSGAAIYLGNLPGKSNSSIGSINNNGEVVGTSW